MNKVPEAATGEGHQTLSQPNASESFVAAHKHDSATVNGAGTHGQGSDDFEVVTDPGPLEHGGSASTAISNHPGSVGSVPVAGASASEPSSEIVVLGNATPLGDHPVTVVADPRPASNGNPAVSKSDEFVRAGYEHRLNELEQFIKNWREFERSERIDPLLIEARAGACSPLPEPLNEDDLAQLRRRLQEARGKSTDYAVRFSARVQEECAKLHMSTEGHGSEYVIDHFIKVKFALSKRPRFVEVNGERLTDPVTVPRTVKLIEDYCAAIHSPDFQPDSFLRLLFNAYKNVRDTRSTFDGSPTITLNECQRALEKLRSSQFEAPVSRQAASGSHPRGRPPGSARGAAEAGAQFSRRRPVRDSIAHLETRFRSDMSRLIALTMHPVIDDHELVIHQLRGTGKEGMSFIEPRSRKLVQYLTIEFTKVSNHAE